MLKKVGRTIRAVSGITAILILLSATGKCGVGDMEIKTYVIIALACVGVLLIAARHHLEPRGKIAYIKAFWHSFAHKNKLK